MCHTGSIGATPGVNLASAVAAKINDFNDSDLGRAAQGIPDEPLLMGAIGGAAATLGKLGRSAPLVEEGAEFAVQFHHPYPQYLGGKFEQLLEPLPKELHDAYHSGLDKILPRQIRGGATDFYASLSRAERDVNMQKLETYTRSFDQMHGTHLWEAAVREGATGVPTR
jgi:hypothetical protein